jgi:signal transduction histidine kinase/ligand-binding sensor domain-containing protein/DNA-binding response OmpR family regulator
MQTMTCLLYKYRFLFFVVSILLSQTNSVWSQPDNSLLFNNLKVKDGLPVNEIFTINQDSTGFMWFGTINGFVRYDGYEMKIFRQDGTGKIALPDNQITSIEKDKKSGLWIGCYEGLIYQDTKTGKSKLIDLGGIREVRCLLTLNDSILWVGTSEGLFKLNTRTFEYKIYNQQNTKLGSNIVRSLYTDSDGNVWIGTFNGLNEFTLTGEMLFFDLKGSYKPELKNNLILEIQPYSKNDDSFLWIGTETGLVLFNRKTHQPKVFNSQNSGFGNEVVKCIFPIKPGQVYFGTDFGFYFFDSKTMEIQASTHDPFNNYSLANNVVWDIFQDNAGIIWLATSNGISQLNINQGMFHFTPVYNKVGDNQVGNQVNDLYSDRNETVWLATKKGVIALYKNGETKTFTADNNASHPLVLNNINTISGDNLGRIWIGSAGGINVWDERTNRMYTITADFDLNKGLRSNYISAFITPSDGSFWVITWGGGMYKAKGNFSNVEDIFFEFVADFNTNIFSANKKIWLKHEKKVFTIDLTTLQISNCEKLNNFIGNKDISSLQISSKGDLWVGLNNQLLKYNTRSEEISTHDIFTGKDSYINNLVEDFNGDIWGTTLTSIFKFSATSYQVEAFPMNKGIPLDIFLPQSNGQSGKGVLFFGGNDGFISFNPKEIRKNSFQPTTVITSLKVNNRQINTINELEGRNSSDKLVTFFDNINLKYDQHSISIGFSSLHFGDPFRNMYAYKLEGYDKEWNYTTGFQNLATYSNLSPDKYRFIVKGTNNDGVWFENSTSLNIEVKPPVWASAWAIIIYIIILQLILMLLFLTVRNKAEYKERIRKITIEKEKNEQLASEKQQFFTNISHEFRTPLNLIIGPVQTLIDKYPLDPSARSLLQLVSKNSRRLISLVNQLMDIRKIENKSLRLNLQPIELIEFCREQYDLFIDLAINQKIRYCFEAPEMAIQLVTDPAKLESIIQNLLSNAFKFTPHDGHIVLRVEIDDKQQFRITVSDTGIGIAPEDEHQIFSRFYQGKDSSTKTTGSGIGLNLVKEYCELMNGKIWFESQPGNGTDFIVEIPIKSDLSISYPVDSEKQKLITTESLLKEKKQFELARTESLSLILLVDDHPDTMEYIKICMAGKYSFLTACNGKEALKLLEKHKIDLLVSDIMMPEINGLSLCERVKTNPQFSHIPVILLTAMAMASHEIDGLRAGADAYITKPFNIEVLDAQIESLLSRNQKVNNYIKRQLIVENQDVEIESYGEKLLQETIQFINQNISDPEISIDKMCKAMGISHSSLYRKIKDQTGMTLNELIRQVKLKKAAQLIKSRKYSIAEIMDETGFTNHSYFAKCFKNEYNMSPREYAEKK